MKNEIDLGLLGESYFSNLCHSIGIIPNKSDVDKTGWDYIVEFPLDEVEKIPLDKSRAGIQALVQVKSTQNCKSGSWQIKLSNLKRFLESDLPCFFVFLHFGLDYSIQDLYLLHFDEAVMEIALKKLREATTNKWDIRHKKARIRYNKSNRLRIEDEKLLIKRIRKNYEKWSPDYALQKKKFRDTLGYDKFPSDLKVSFDSPNVDLLDKLYLGEVEKIDIKSFELNDNRFGIPFSSRFGGGSLSIKADKSIVVRFTFLNGDIIETDARLNHSISSYFNGVPKKIVINLGILIVILELEPKNESYFFEFDYQKDFSAKDIRLFKDTFIRAFTDRKHVIDLISVTGQSLKLSGEFYEVEYLVPRLQLIEQFVRIVSIDRKMDSIRTSFNSIVKCQRQITLLNKVLFDDLEHLRIEFKLEKGILLEDTLVKTPFRNQLSIDENRIEILMVFTGRVLEGEDKKYWFLPIERKVLGVLMGANLDKQINKYFESLDEKEANYILFHDPVVY